MKKQILMMLTLSSVLCGCATQYGKQGFTGGYKETQLAPDIWRVNCQGNAYVSAEKMSDYALLRAAELCLDNGFTHFIVADERDTAQIMAWHSGSAATVSGRNIYFSPSRTSFMGKPGTTIVVKGFKSEPAGGIAFDAAFLDKSIRQRYKIKPR